MKNLPLNMLRAMAATYETGGIRPAGRQLGVTHSSVSRMLKELEAWIETPLFERRQQRRSLQFTTEGEALGRAALASLTELENAVAAVRESRRPNSVILSTTPSFAVRWLLPRLADFEGRYPAIEVSVVVDQRRKAPIDSGADIAIRMGRGPWQGMNCQPLMDDALYPVLSRTYWQDSGRPDRVEQIRRLRLLHDRDPNASWSLWQQTCGPVGLDVRRGPRFTSSDLVIRAAEQGLGVALARDRLVRTSIENGTLIRPFGSAQVELENAHWLILNPDQPQRATTGIMIDWLKGQALSQQN